MAELAVRWRHLDRAGFSGLRVREVSGLLWSDLDLTRGFANVQRTIEEDEDGTLLEYPPKNGKARVVPLPAAACDELRVLLTAQKEYRLAQAGPGLERGRPRGPQEGRHPDGALDLEEPVVELGGAPEDRPAPADPWPERLLRHLVYEAYGVKQAQEWLGHSDPATTLRHYVRLTTAARAKAVAGLDEVTRAALGAAEDKVLEDAQPLEDNVVALSSRRH